jgi:predicted Zn-dependent protease
LSEDFRGGEVPRFNDEGSLAPDVLEIISEGSLKNSLVSGRSSLEYKVPSNGAVESEMLRSPSLGGGNLEEKDILPSLHEGLYVSNLHYLNWSDQPEGRITGMTRYACFWVENAKLKQPIENLRFDDSIFRLFGTELADLTKKRLSIPDVSTYGSRSLGNTWVPGALISKMRFTL